MANIAVVIIVLILLWYIVAIVRGRGGIVARRGTGISADLAVLAETPRVRLRAVTREAPDRVRLVLTPDAGPDSPTSPDLELVVFLRAEEFGWDLLHDWSRSQSSLAMVMPPDSRILNLRSIDDLQPLTLSRVDRS